MTGSKRRVAATNRSATGTNKAMPDSFDEAVRYLSDRDRRLEGEDPATTHPDDARHWRSVYAELLDFKDRVLETTDQLAPAIPEAAEELSADAKLMNAERERFRERLEYWTRRERELRGGTG